MLRKHYQILLFLVITALYFIFLKVNIGGDDSRLYLSHPLNWKNGVVNSMFLGYFYEFNPHITFYSFNLIGSIIDSIFTPTYNFKILMSLNIFLGLTFSFYFFKELSRFFQIKVSDKLHLTGSLLYALSPITYYTLFLQPLAISFALSAFAILSFFFVKGINEKSYKYALYLNLAILPFSFVLSTAPIVAGYVLIFGLLIFLLKIFFPQDMAFKLKFILFAALLFFAFNIYWIIPWFVSVTSTSSLATEAISNYGKSGAISAIYTIAQKSYASDVIRFFPSSGYFDLGRLGFFGVVSNFLSWTFPVIIVLGLFLTIVNRVSKRTYLVVFLVTFFAFYLQVVNLTDVGIDLFVVLTDKIPGWTMFRNFFNKFIVPFLLIYTYFIIYNLYVCQQYISTKLKNGFLVLLLSLIFLNSVPFIIGSFSSEVPELQTNNADFDSSYLDLYEYLSSESTFRVMSFPLTNASWSMLLNQDKGYIKQYVGLSPLTGFKAIDDINGQFAFKSIDSELAQTSDIFIKSIEQRDHATFNKVLSLLDVEYIIIDERVLQKVDDPNIGMYVWGGKSVQNTENISSIMQSPNFVLVESFGEKDTLKLYKNTLFKGPVYSSQNIVQLTNFNKIWSKQAQSIIGKDPEYITLNKNSADIPSIKVHNKELIGLNKKPYSFQDFNLSSWDEKWLWPDASVNPASPKYILVRVKEYLMSLRSQNLIDQLDFTIWMGAKRAEEYKKFSNSESNDRYNNNISKNIKIIQNIKNNNMMSMEDQTKYFRKSYLYIIRAQEHFGVKLSSANSENLQKLLHYYDMHMCKYDYCYELPENTKSYKLSKVNGTQLDISSSKKVRIIDDDLEYTLINRKLGVNFPSHKIQFLDRSQFTNKVEYKDLMKTMRLDKSLTVVGYAEINGIKNGQVHLLRGTLSGKDMKIKLVAVDLVSEENLKLQLVELASSVKTKDLETSSFLHTLASINDRNGFIILLLSDNENLNISKQEILLKDITDSDLFIYKTNTNADRNSRFCDSSTERITVYRYVVTNTCSNNIVLSSMYTKLWDLKAAEAKSSPNVTNELVHSSASGFKNIWFINEKTPPKSEITFKFEKILPIGKILSGVAVFLALVIFIYNSLRKKKQLLSR